MAEFARFSPDQRLAFLIHGYWFLRTGKQVKLIELVPDGYPELLFVRRGAVWYRVGTAALWYSFNRCGVLGQLGGQFQISIPPECEILFVKFHPWTLYTALQTPMYLLNNAMTELAGLSLGQEWIDLERAIRSANDNTECCRLLDTFFLRKLQSSMTTSPLLHFSVQTIFQRSGAISLDQLNGHLKVSNRYLQRLFKQQLGLSPKHYARIIRVKKASMHMLNPQFNRPLVQIAAELDYFDQSHFLKDFKSIVGKSPTAFLKQEHEFSPEALAVYLGQWAYS
ncbi:MAG: helix-turn-helix domain-containing protein [Bacteroidota bacterium]